MSGVYHKRMLSSVRDEMKVLLANDDKRIVVLDDDPTGEWCVISDVRCCV